MNRKILELEDTGTALAIRLADGATAADLEDADSFEDAIEWQLCNGWDRIRPEEAGALTDGLIITQDCERDDQGKLTRVGVVYWDADYMVADLLETLKERGVASMVRAS